MRKLYFEDLLAIKETKSKLETPLSIFRVGRDIVKGYIDLTLDNHPSHSDQRYNIRKGYTDIFIPGFLIPGLSEGFFKKHYEYMVHMNRGFRAKFLRPLFPDDMIKVIDEIVEAEFDSRLTVDNSNPVKILRSIINQKDELVSVLQLDYLILGCE